MELERNMKNKCLQILDFFPCLILIGGRQCGKTTLARQLGKGWDYVDLENPDHFDRLQSAPTLFFKEHAQHVIIDEAQKFPQLFEILRGVIDADRKTKGRFILTGSSSFDLLHRITETLAGRVGIVEVPPFKINEITKQTLSPFFHMFSDGINSKSIQQLSNLVPRVGIEEIKERLLFGSYPEPTLEADSVFQEQWMKNYFVTYIERDIRSQYPKLDIIKYRRFVNSLAWLSGTILNRSEIGRSIEISEKTARDYLEIVEGTFFWRSLKAFQTSKIKNTIKMPKGFYRDSGLNLFLQKIRSEEQLIYHPNFGNYFEAFVIEEIIRGFGATMQETIEFSHFRTKRGAEVDLIIEGSFGLIPVDIKWHSHTPRKALSGMKNFLEALSLPLGIVVNNCDKPVRLDENIYAIPVAAL